MALRPHAKGVVAGSGHTDRLITTGSHPVSSLCSPIHITIRDASAAWSTPGGMAHRTSPAGKRGVASDGPVLDRRPRAPTDPVALRATSDPGPSHAAAR